MQRTALAAEPRRRVKLLDTLPPPRDYTQEVVDGQIMIEVPPPDERNGAYHIPTPYTRRQVELMQAYGMKREAIAHIVGVSMPTLTKHYALELEFGAAKANARIAQRLYDTAERGEGREGLTAMIFWLKSRARWTETAVDVNHNHSGTVNHDVRSVSNEERAARLVQILAAGSASGVGSAALQHLRAMVAAARPSDPSLVITG